MVGHYLLIIIWTTASVMFYTMSVVLTPLPLQVLNMHGKVVPMKPASLQKKRENKKAAALDSEQNAIQCK